MDIEEAQVVDDGEEITPAEEAEITEDTFTDPIIESYNKGETSVLNDVLLVSVQMTDYRVRRNDISMTFVTAREVSPETQGFLSALVDKFAMLGIKKAHFVAEEAKKLQEAVKEVNREYGGKTPSQRLHSVLYVLHKKKEEAGEQVPGFTDYYNDWTERAIDKIKKLIQKYEI